MDLEVALASAPHLTSHRAAPLPKAPPSDTTGRIGATRAGGHHGHQGHHGHYGAKGATTGFAPGGPDQEAERLQAVNREILDFLSKRPMQSGGLEVNFLRSPDFFALLRAHSQDSHALVARSKEGVVGIGSVCRRLATMPFVGDSELKGEQPKRRGLWYLGDLKVAPSRRVAFEWRRFVSELLKDGDLAVTVLLADNVAAKKALVDNPHLEFRYELWKSYDFVSLLARHPAAQLLGSLRGRRLEESLRVERAHARNRAELEAFLETTEGRRAFGYVLDKNELSRRLRDWPHFHLEDFILVREGREGPILACCAPWDCGGLKSLEVSGLPAFAQGIMRLGGKAFGSGSELLRGESLHPRLVYLTHFNWDRRLPLERQRQVLEHLLGAAWGDRSRFQRQALSFADFGHPALKAALRSFICYRVPAHYYTVRHKDCSLADLGVPKSWLTEKGRPFRPDPGFEAALV